MRYLDVPDFFTLTNDIGVSVRDQRIECVLESYSCKNSQQDKKQFNALFKDKRVIDFEVLSPPQQSFLTCRRESEMLESAEFNRETSKTLFYLKSTLSSCFPDYDFSSIDSRQFCREPHIRVIINSINNKLYEVIGDTFHESEKTLWKSIDHEIMLNECKIFSYIPQVHSDPFCEDDILWSFNFMFFNSRLNRIVLFACRSRRDLNCSTELGGGMEDIYNMEEFYEDQGYSRKIQGRASGISMYSRAQ